MPKDAPSPLSGEWINDRIIAVVKMITDEDGILDHIIDDRLTSSGYLPMEVQLDATLLRRVLDQQVEALLKSIPNEETRAAIIAKLADIDKNRTNVV
jgi:hypothetical protein